MTHDEKAILCDRVKVMLAMGKPHFDAIVGIIQDSGVDISTEEVLIENMNTLCLRKLQTYVAVSLYLNEHIAYNRLIFLIKLFLFATTYVSL